MAALAVLGAGAWGTALAAALASRHKVSLWARDHAQASFLKLVITRVVLAVKGPIRMRAELFVTFVETICRQEKRFRIGNVNGHRQVERSGRFPHRVESLVVDFY